MKNKKMSFFKKMWLVITDFRTYPFLVKHEKFINSILYLLTLTLIMSVFFTASVYVKLTSTINEVIKNYNDTIPEFELSSGELTVYAKYSQKIGDESFLVINTDYTYDEYKETKDYSRLVIYDTVALVNKDKITIENDNEAQYIVSFDALKTSLNKQNLYEILLYNYENSNYFMYIITLYISIFVGYFIVNLMRVFFLACIISIICTLTGIRLSFKNYIKISVYAYTLPLIIELISYCLVGAIKDYAYYTVLLLTYIYMVYAIRAIRLDAFIMMFSSKNIKKHTTDEFQKELEKYSEITNNEEQGENEKTDDKEDNNK